MHDIKQDCDLCGLIIGLQGLGKRICTHAGLEQRLLPTAELIELLAHLAQVQPLIMSETTNPVSSRNLSAIVQEEIKTKKNPRQQDYLLSVHQAGVIQAVEHIFHHLEHCSDIDPAAYRLIGHLQIDITRSLLQDPGSLSVAEHALRRFCEILLRICRLYDSFSGRRATQLMRRVAAIVERLSPSPLPLAAAFEPAITELLTLFNAHNDENLQLARNLIAKEQGLSLRDDAKLMVNREMLGVVDGLQLPVLFVRFLDRVWSKYLYITYLRHGMDSKEWSTGIEIIRILGQSLEIRGRNEMFQYYSTHVTGAMSSLRDAAFSIHQDEFLVQNLLERLDDIHMRILNEEMVDLGECVTIHSGRQILAEAEDREQPEEVKLLRVGDWYKLSENGLERRCKLIEKNSTHHYCLFTNLSGIRTGKYGFRQIADLVKAGSLQRIESAALFAAALRHSCTQLTRQMPELEQQAAEAERLWQSARQRKRDQEAQARSRAEAERRRSREEEMHQEHQRREEARLRQEAEAQAKEERSARQRLIQRHLSMLARMQPGGWLELIGNDEQRIACKLGLRIKSTGKLIFVDSLGRKVAEFNRLELAERIVDGSASIMDYGVAFDETLASLVNQRSEKIKTNEPR